MWGSIGSCERGVLTPAKGRVFRNVFRVGRLREDLAGKGVLIP